MKNNYHIIALSSLLFVSCTQVEFSDRSNQSRNEIAISAQTSRSSIIDDTEIKSNGFSFFAFEHSNVWTSDGSTTAPFIYDRKASYTNSAWGYTPTECWPNSYVSFFAYAPQADETNGITISTAETTGAPTIDFTMASNLKDTPDLVTDARGDVRDKVSTDGSISFQLSHILSRIAIKAKCQSALPSNTHFYISSITLSCNGTNKIYKKAKYKFENDSWDYTSSTSVTELNLANMIGFTTKDEKSLIELNQNGNATDIIPENSSFLCIPINNANGSVNSGDIKIIVKYYTSSVDNNVETYSTEKTSTIDLPVGALKKGQFVTYTLTTTSVISIMDVTVNAWSISEQELVI